MDLSQLVPLYLTIVMIVLVVLAMVGPGGKQEEKPVSEEEQDR